jgi:hypothetical protein
VASPQRQTVHGGQSAGDCGARPPRLCGGIAGREDERRGDFAMRLTDVSFTDVINMWMTFDWGFFVNHAVPLSVFQMSHSVQIAFEKI